MFRQATGIGMAFVGVLVGAGFASGQEMLQFTGGAPEPERPEGPVS